MRTLDNSHPLPPAMREGVAWERAEPRSKPAQVLLVSGKDGIRTEQAVLCDARGGLGGCSGALKITGTMRGGIDRSSESSQ